MIDKLIKAIGGGGPITSLANNLNGPKQNPPIYVSSANDPRYKMYQDSLHAYKSWPPNYLDAKVGKGNHDYPGRSMSKSQAIAFINVADKDTKAKAIHLSDLQDEPLYGITAIFDYSGVPVYDILSKFPELVGTAATNLRDDGKLSGSTENKLNEYMVLDPFIETKKEEELNNE